jgi:hypothetical protein
MDMRKVCKCRQDGIHSQSINSIDRALIRVLAISKMKYDLVQSIFIQASFVAVLESLPFDFQHCLKSSICSDQCGSIA